MHGAVEKCGNHEGTESAKTNALEACSACEGDYEDPDRTAWSAEEEEIADDDDLEIVSEIGSAARDSNLVEEKAILGEKAATDTAAGWRRNDGKTSDEG
jgi:hypothetical protein